MRVSSEVRASSGWTERVVTPADPPRVVDGLVTGTHTITVTVLGLPAPPSAQARVHLDYIDVWDGQQMPDTITSDGDIFPVSFYHGRFGLV